MEINRLVPFCNTPLMVSDALLMFIKHALARSNGADLSGFFKSLQETGQPIGARRGGAAVIPVTGALYHRRRYGITYNLIREAVRGAAEDPGVDLIILDIDSHGGVVNGAFDLADYIYSVRQNVKPVYALANENALSAAYLIAAASSRIFVNRTSAVGSIGVRAQHVDWSGWNEKQGIRVTTVYAGERKNDFNPDEPLTNEALKAMQKSVDYAYGLFVSAVSKYRGLSEKAVQETEAAVFEGQEAIDAGLADELVSFNDFETTGGEIFINNMEENTMDLTKLKSVLQSFLSGEQADETMKMLDDLGYVRGKDAAAAKEEIELAAVRAAEKERKRIMGLFDFCVLAGLPGELPGVIEKAEEDARSYLIDARAKKDMEAEIHTQHSGRSLAESPVVRQAREKNEKIRRVK